MGGSGQQQRVTVIHLVSEVLRAVTYTEPVNVFTSLV